jgi:hypothetical protein
MTKMIQLVVFVPVILMVALGLAAVRTVTPASFGWLVVFALNGVLLLMYAWRTWRLGGWLMTPSIARTFGCGVGLLMLFNVVAVFQDPAPFSLFCAVSAFLTVNTVLMLYVTIASDRAMRTLERQCAANVRASATMTVSSDLAAEPQASALPGRLGSPTAAAADVLPHGTDGGDSVLRAVEKALAPAPRFAEQGCWSVLSPALSQRQATAAADVVPQQSSGLWPAAPWLYAVCVASTAVLAVACWDKEAAYPNQGFGILLAVVVLDATLLLLRRSGLEMAPLSTCVFLVVLPRVSLAIFAGIWGCGRAARVTRSA